MNQLDLFVDAPRHYHEALQRLAAADPVGCREAVAIHRATCPAGPDPGPVEDAVEWLAAHTGGAATDPASRGRALLGACRALREGRAPVPILGAGGETAARLTRTLARQALETMASAGLGAADLLDEGLPWGVLFLWVGDPMEARRVLLAHAREPGDRALPWLALGDACWATRWHAEAWSAYREGFGLDPSGGGWRPDCAEVSVLPSRFAADPSFSGAWWAVGAYLEGAFPAFEPASPAEVARRWRRFLQLREAAGERAGSAAALFFAGLFLSAHAHLLPAPDLGLVRATMRRLHPEAWELHREQLERGTGRSRR